MEKQALEALLHKFNSGTATEEEKAIVESWYNLLPYDAEAPGHQQILEAKLRDWEQITGRTAPVRRRLWPRVAVAAAAVAAIVFGVWFMTRESGALKQVQGDVAYKNDIAPGKQGATLTLANGKKIRLSDAVNGELAKEAGVTITKTANGQLLYVISSERSDTETSSGQGKRSLDPATSTDPSKVGMTNVLSTAKGETYQVKLPDGTVVYLNAASSLKYPSSFAKLAKRKVALSGEGYFQVSKDKAHPFVVESMGQEVEVLGTEFNINSYADEGVTKTTLLEGLVSVSSSRTAGRDLSSGGKDLSYGRDDDRKRNDGNRTGDGEAVVLKPSQQAVLTGNKQLSVRQVDVTEAVAWKNNEFMFESQSIEQVMRMVSRWYDVTVIYEGQKPVKKFSGGVSRFDNLSKLLEILEGTGGAHFRIEGRKVYVSD